MRKIHRAACAALVGTVLVLTGCATSPSTPGASGSEPGKTITVVAAENFWGLLADQLGGDKVDVHSIVSSPGADPHDYEATASDARAIATADLTVVNGLGYDGWADDLAAANPAPNRANLNVGSVLALPDDANPHRWYNPADVAKVAESITAAYKKISPDQAGYFDTQLQAFSTTAMAEYDKVATEIRTTFGGTPVGGSESVLEMLVPSLGLDLVTPPGFLSAVSHGDEPTVADKTTADQQIRSGAIKAYVYNAQNASPDVQQQVDAARAQGIPVTTVTETPPAGTQSWQQWQTDQLVALRDALSASSAR
ncbi:zinc ABC transporter substrate-binding protein [Rhodococcus sp. X156]|uniref:metal ABC transporter solute-binding protein, Zn/Mn family n=1 Tax=Rhodococcus sp. X156 TaxID=2499145 RepID=UPI000FD6CA4C|nr:zinc ABC transporter substrate-binding protein [Rhodococcus sp. X156]